MVGGVLRPLRRVLLPLHARRPEQIRRSAARAPESRATAAGAGLEKTRVKKTPAQWVFLGFYVFFWVFGVFYIFAKKREFLGFFFSFKNTLWFIQTLNYIHLY